VQFEWDDAKNAANVAKHGIDFRTAIRVFEGPRIRLRSDRAGEPRRTAVGLIDGLVIAVAYTLRGRTRRIISARLGSRRERRRFDDAFPDAR
jgi:uncharacterized DUF497 family protein